MTTATVATTYFIRTRGKRHYELSNHLGNVQVVVSDRKVPQDTNTDGVIDYYVADIVSATDYYAFGAVMPDRSFNAAGYRFGFNGKENDNEVKGTGNEQDYGMRIYDPRLGRFLSVDPISSKYPELTPYQFASNRPISGVDQDGLEYADATGKDYGNITRSQIRALQDKGITIHTTTSVQLDKGYIYHATQYIGDYTIRVTQAGSWTDEFSPKDNDAALVTFTFQNYEVEYANTSNGNGKWDVEEAFNFRQGGRTDMDGASGTSDASGKGQPETTYGGPTIDAKTDRYLALPNVMFTDYRRRKDHPEDRDVDHRYGVKGGDVAVLRYKGIQSVAPALDKAGIKLGEESGAVNSIDFGINIKGGNAGIDKRVVRATVFRNTTSGAAQTDREKNTGTRPRIYNSPRNQEKFKTLEQAIENTRNPQKP